MIRLVVVAVALLAVACSSKSSSGTAEASSTAGASSPVADEGTRAPPLPKDLFSAASRRHLDALLAWQNAHLPKIDDKPEKAPDETDAGYKRRLYQWQLDATNALQRYDKDMCLSFRGINCPNSPLTKALKAEGFRVEIDCSVVDVIDLGYGGGEVVCASRDDGKVEFTVVANRVSELRKGELIRFSHLTLGGPSKRLPRLFGFRGNLLQEAPISFERVASR